MEYITRSAARDYLWSVRASFRSGLATWTESLDRVLALRDLCAPGSYERAFSDRLLKLEDWSTEGEWADNQEEQQAIQEQPDHTPSRLIRARRSTGGSEYEEEPFIWQYLVSSATGLGGWEFYQYDDDPYPSVPHGHQRANKK